MNGVDVVLQALVVMFMPNPACGGRVLGFNVSLVIEEVQVVASGIRCFSGFELSGLMAWGFDDFVEVKNENFKIYDFIFELNFLGFFVCLFLKKIFGDEPKEHEHVLQKNK